MIEIVAGIGIAFVSSFFSLVVAFLLTMIANWRHDQEQRRQHRAALNLIEIELRERLELLGASSEWDTIMRTMNADSTESGTAPPFADDLRTHRRLYENALSTIGQLPVSLSSPIAAHYESTARMHRDFHECFKLNGTRDQALDILKEYISGGQDVLNRMDEARDHFRALGFWDWLWSRPRARSRT
ncbi:hypothetical protein [Pontivivens nitratireducens]|uniref:Uncharacterized protein n=1 Tax=Pontivivens nitratireducens TaxID=2758038 RepID=A0A6G7VIW5_9RHOB|nr:hypothetical protein [Pontibrevibacter nitratireducens]QIK39882.1 hypothetical protein G8E03_03340 [Pontibrevibacter nitratireducens]